MPHALLLSPDDQAVTAITDVLQELAVAFERPLDGVSAAQKLNSQSFDLVLVDCENLPAAKLIFDVCRRGKNGVNPVPIAIVDGRAGLPTAFRLGAELILTKPVSKDQARSTIRAAVSRVRKTVQPGENAPAHPDSAKAHDLTDHDLPDHDLPATVSPAASAEMTMTSAIPATEARARAAAAGAGSSTSVDQSGTAASTNSQFAVHEVDSPSDSTFSKSTRPQIPSDDPVLAELEKAELEKSEQSQSSSTESHSQESQKQDSARASKPARQPASKADVPVLSSTQPGANKTRRPLVALLMLAAACGGFYAAWMYQPGFQAIVQPQIDRALGLVGMAPTTKAPAKPVALPANATATVVKTELSPAQAAAPHSANGAASPVAATSASPTSATPSAAPNTAVQSKPDTSAALGIKSSAVTSTTATTTKMVDAKPAVATPTDTKIDAAPALTNTPLPDEKTAIILSSKGAESRLSYSPPPKYPAGTRTGSGEATVVLKAVVDDKGKVEAVRLVEGNAALAPVALEAVKHWRYRPYLRDGKALPFQTVVIVDFSH
jgi:TonB family protein